MLLYSISKTSICDRALQIVGFSQVSSVPQTGSRGAKAVERTYLPTVFSELQKHFWHFSIKRARIPASATPPSHTKAYQYPLPGDCIMLAPRDQDPDFALPSNWIVEGKMILTDDSSPLDIRYVSSDITESMFDPVFAEAVSCAIALAICEEVTNSNTKLSNIASLYDEQMALARKRGSFLVQKPRAPVSSWISKRG